jgi:hypothetical protein
MKYILTEEEYRDTVEENRKMREVMQWFMTPDHPIGSDPELIRKFEEKIKPFLSNKTNSAQ